ncbi:MAG TPA: DNA primase [Candidatus Limnocylindrales bacterium]|nr:DNA primase [Candidatus Limnocylindrales bacterium]
MAVGVVAEIKGRLPVADVVGETVQLKKAGTTLKGLCPFHGEKTPSFVVTPGRDTWHCFGCGKHGDIFTFVMERDTVGFPEALKILAARAGVELDERTKQEDARNARLRTVLEAAIAFYHAVLTKSPTGAPALEYLRGRGFTDATIEKHQLGWAPGGWDQLGRQLASKRQVTAQELLDVGLASPRQRGGGVYDRFRERVIFPIRDANGHPVGLGGRILPVRSEGGGRVPVGHPPEDVDRGPKYLNSPATSLFDKSRTLYLIDRAKTAIRKGGQAVIVEGYTDALMAHQAGFENVVASLGTALTPQQVALITRYAKRIALAYDVDAAGEKAGTFGATALEEVIRQLAADASGVELDDVRVVRLPEGRDPDEVMRDNPDEWREIVRVARPIVDHLIDVHARAHDLRTPGGQARFVDAVLPIIRNLPNPVLRDAYLGRVRQVSGVEERTLLEAMRTRRDREHDGRAGSDRFTASAVTRAPDALPVTEILRGVSRTEQELLRLVLLVPESHDPLLDGLGPDRMPSQVARELFRAVVIARTRDDHGVRPPFVPTAILDSLDEETRALGQALISRPGPNPRDLGDRSLAYEIERLMLELDDAEWQERSGFNRDAMAEAEREGDTGIYERLMFERRHLNEQRRSLDKRRDQTRLLSRPPVPTG